MTSTVEDLMEVRNASGRAVSFIVTGDPPTQERSRMAFMRAFRPRMYDPSSRKKRLYAAMVRTAMATHGLTVPATYGLAAPYFSADEPISFRLLLVLPRRKQDLMVRDGVTVVRPTAQAFPRKKDVDNMLKFVMDALQGVLYWNDVTITSVSVTKTFPEIADAGGWTFVQLSTSNQVLPLANVFSV
jgi:Holliday junction resolvase RusA-like endonuclease